MEHIIPDEEWEEHDPVNPCKCDPRVIYDKISGDLVTIHQPFDKNLSVITDEEALEILHLDEDEEDDMYLDEEAENDSKP